MQNKLRLYIESQPQELTKLQGLAEESGMKVFGEVDDNYPSGFIDTIPFFISICEKFGISADELKPLCEEFIRTGRGLLIRLSQLRPSSRPHEVTTSFLLTVIIANKHRTELKVEDLQNYGWHSAAADIVLGQDG